MAAFRRIAMLAVVVALAGCSWFGAASNGGPPAGALPFPDGCAAFHLSGDRCAAIVEGLRQEAGIGPGDFVRVELLPDDCGKDALGRPILCTRTSVAVVRVRFTTTAGNAIERTQFCGVGGQYSIRCTDRPEIQVFVPSDGYRDVPCSGEPPDGCATPYPQPAPADQALEQRIDVAELNIALDHVGEYVINIGTGSLANGILEESSMTIADLRPDSFVLDGAVSLEIQSLAADGKPFDNYYARGWRAGIEPIAARLRFAVLSFEPDAFLRITNIHVN